MIRRVCVVGAGAIGSLFAAHLARVAEVAVLTRREEHARALRDEGLRVSGRAAFVARVEGASDPDEIGEVDLVLLATKGTEVDAAAARLAGRFPGAAVMTVQNGLGMEEIVRRHGGWPVLSAVTFMSGTRHSDTHVEYILDTETWLGPYGETPYALVEDIAALIQESGLKARAFQDLKPATQRGSRHYPSMLEDVEARRPTEVDLITGALVREADRVGVDAPLHRALYRLVKAREASYS